MASIIIQESLRAVFYIPFYAALAGKAFEAEGLDVRFASSPRPDVAALRILSGEVDVTWGGPMRVMQTYDQVPGCDLVCFCEVVGRDPFTLVGAKRRTDFRLSDLIGLRLGLVSEVPTPQLCLEDDLRRAGLSFGQMAVNAGRTMPENVAALLADECDVIQVPEPFVEELTSARRGYLWLPAAARGATSYTTLYSTRKTLASRPEEMQRLVRAMYRTQKWLHATAPAEIAALVAPYFSDVPPARLAAAISRYLSLGIWGRTPRLPRSGYDRLKECLVSGGFTKGVAYEVAVDNRFAEGTMEEDPPALSP